MGKKDAHLHNTPVEKYRKEIGKQDYKKSKKEIKRVRKQALAKESNWSIKDVALVMISILVLIFAIYGFFFIYAQGGSSHDK
ncbi:triple QxxK/R motif-containing protein-like [Glandiceps talaboti]